jgi:hypothetical protein
MIAPVRLYLTKDRSRVVCDGDAAAAFLLAGKGCEIPRGLEPLAKLTLTASPVKIATADSGDAVQFQTKESWQPKLRRR